MNTLVVIAVSLASLGTLVLAAPADPTTLKINSVVPFNAVPTDLRKIYKAPFKFALKVDDGNQYFFYKSIRNFLEKTDRNFDLLGPSGKVRCISDHGSISASYHGKVMTFIPVKLDPKAKFKPGSYQVIPENLNPRLKWSEDSPLFINLR